MSIAARLMIARKRRRLTAKALAEKSGLQADTISRLENSLRRPDDGTLQKLATALDYPESFFLKDACPSVDTGAVSFRSFSKMSARERDAAEAAGAIGLELGAWVEERFSLPEPNLPDMTLQNDPETAAFNLRQHWSLGERPIGNLLNLLEVNGVRVFSLSENTASVNAFSFWQDNKPYVFLNNFKTAESSIFDSAHELGHLVMHKHGDPKGGRLIEKEANQFASAFLMPERDVRAAVIRPVNVETLVRSKMRWRVSAMALAYRLHYLGILSEWQYKSTCIELGKRGYRSGEPIGVDRETSSVWKKVLATLWGERITKNDVARDLSIPLDELEGLIWNLASEEKAPSRGKPNLMVV